MNLLFNVCKSNLFNLSKISKSDTELSSVTFLTMSRQCLQSVSRETSSNTSPQYLPASLTSLEANHLVTSGQLRKGCLVRLKSFQANQVKGKKFVKLSLFLIFFFYFHVTDLYRILIILDLEVLQELGEFEKLGEPKPLENRAEEDEKTQPATISGNGFYGSKAQSPQMPANTRAAPTRSNASASSHATIYPIEAISPYNHKWTIKARCTSKSNIKTWHNRNGEGKLFSVNLLDDSGEIRATGFNNQCEVLYDVFQEGSVYYISSPCRVQIAKKQFTNLNNDYELTFEKETVVEKVS